MSSWYQANHFFIESTLIDSIFVFSFFMVFRAGLFSLAQVGQMAIGAYTVAVLGTKANWPPIATIPVAVLVTAVGSLLFVLPVLRLRGVYLALGSIAFAGIVTVLAENLDLTGGPLGIRNIPGSIGMAQIVIALVVVVALMVLIQRSHYSTVFRAVRLDERTAQGLGVQTGWIKVVVLLISAAIAGLVGGLQTYTLGFVTPDRFSFSLLIIMTAYAFIGGTGHWVGAFLVAIIGDTLNNFLVVNSSSTQQIIFGVLLILAVSVAPDGITDPALLRRLTKLLRRNRAPKGTTVPAQSATRISDRPAPDPAPVVDPRRRPAAGDVALETADLTVAFRGLIALNGVSLTVAAGDVYGIVGPNGAGKTTLINAITGYLRPTKGSIAVHGQDILNIPPHELVHHGVARTYQNFKLFEGESVLDNVLMGRHTFFSAGMRSVTLASREKKEQTDSALLALERVGMSNSASLSVAGLPYGARRRVELARALACQPTLLLLDEPAAGMSRHESDEIGDLVCSIARQGTTVVLVEHNVRLVTSICQKLSVLQFGRQIMSGAPTEVWESGVVRDAYLGTRRAQGQSTDSTVM